MQAISQEHHQQKQLESPADIQQHQMASTVDLIRQASELNVEGVFCLASADVQKALGSLYRALSVTKQAACQLNFEMQANALKDKSTGKTVEKNNGGMNSLPYNYISVEVPSLENEAFYIYNHALIFDTENSSSPPTSLDICFYSTLIIFNIGLCQHVISQNAASHGERYNSLNQAIRLYNSCSNFLKKFQFHTKNTILLLAGALNNEVYVHEEFVNFKESQETIQKLKQVVAIATTAQNGSGSPQVAQIEQIDKMALNIYTAKGSFAPCA